MPGAVLRETSAAARDSRRPRRFSRWRLTWRSMLSPTRLIACLASLETSLARSWVPFRCSTASAATGSPGTFSSATSSSSTASSETCLPILSKRRATYSRISSVT